MWTGLKIYLKNSIAQLGVLWELAKYTHGYTGHQYEAIESFFTFGWNRSSSTYSFERLICKIGYPIGSDRIVLFLEAEHIEKRIKWLERRKKPIDKEKKALNMILMAKLKGNRPLGMYISLMEAFSRSL